MKHPYDIFKEKTLEFKTIHETQLEENKKKALELFLKAIEEKYNILNPMANIVVEIPKDTLSIDWKIEIQFLKAEDVLKNNGWKITKAVELEDTLKISFSPEYSTKDIQYFCNNKVALELKTESIHTDKESKKECKKESCKNCTKCELHPKILTSIFTDKVETNDSNP